MNKINIGCGADIRPGWTNLDFHKKNGADIAFDLSKIYQGKKLPFKNNEFDIVLCSHVLEDFWNPKPIMDELVRISNYKIIIEVPCDTALNEGNIQHIYPFSQTKLRQYAQGNSFYGQKSPLKVEKCEYYGGKNYWYSHFCANIKNFFGYKIVDATPIRYLFPSGNIRIIYTKNNGETKE